MKKKKKGRNDNEKDHSPLNFSGLSTLVLVLLFYASLPA
jgi:hypothetical protein